MDMASPFKPPPRAPFVGQGGGLGMPGAGGLGNGVFGAGGLGKPIGPSGTTFSNTPPTLGGGNSPTPGGMSSGPAGPTAPGSASPPPCKYFLNGGCLRGDACQFPHTLPDERHLDVNGVGFIFNTNVQNAGAAPMPTKRSSGMLGSAGRKQVPRYRPPETRMESNLPPQLAPVFRSSPQEMQQLLLRQML